MLRRRRKDKSADGEEPSPGAGKPSAELQDLFNAFFDGGDASAHAAGRTSSYPLPLRQHGADVEVELAVGPDEAEHGVVRTLAYEAQTRCGADRCRPDTRLSCRSCHGRGFHEERGFLGTTRLLCGTCHGFGSVPAERCARCDGTGRVTDSLSVNVSVPAGVGEGTLLRVAGHGDVGLGGDEPGDLYARIHIR